MCGQHISVCLCEIEDANSVLSLTALSLPSPDFPDSLDSGFLIRSVQHLAIFSFFPLSLRFIHINAPVL